MASPRHCPEPHPNSLWLLLVSHAFLSELGGLALGGFCAPPRGRPATARRTAFWACPSAAPCWPARTGAAS
eukprot:5809616-Pyramimonas_sp.AAC.1